MLPKLEYVHLSDNALQYGNYGGLDYSAGAKGGSPQVPASPAPVDAYDQLFYEHDLALANASTTEGRVDAHLDVIAGVYDLLF